MRVKFGFLLSVVQSIGGTTDPLENFREVPITMLKKRGDVVTAEDSIVEVVTDKITMQAHLSDLCTAESGKIVVLHYDTGVWRYGDAMEDLPNGDKMLLPVLGEIETDEDVGIDESTTTEQTVPTQDHPVAMPAENVPAPQEVPAEHMEEAAKVRAAPAARRLARGAGINIAEIHGTGPSGRITLADVGQTIEDRDTPKVANASAIEGVILLTPHHERHILAHGLEKGSGTTIASGEPVSPDPEHEEYDFSDLMSFRQNHADDFLRVFKVRFRPWAAVALALVRVLTVERFMIFNGFWHIEDETDRSKDKVALYKAVHLGIAYDRKKWPVIDWKNLTISGQGLRVLTLHNADELGMQEFFVRMDDLLARADHDAERTADIQPKTTLHDWTGHGVIFNNIGAARHKRGRSLITPRMSSILNLGTINREGRGILEIAFDHRMIDGAITTDFLDAMYDELITKVLPSLQLKCAENPENK